jgi:hypothetical protein
MLELSILILSRKTLFNSTFLIQIFHFIWKKQIGWNVRKRKKKIVPICFWLPMRRKKKTELLKTENLSYFLTAPPPY